MEVSRRNSRLFLLSFLGEFVFCFFGVCKGDLEDTCPLKLSGESQLTMAKRFRIEYINLNTSTNVATIDHMLLTYGDKWSIQT